VVNHPIHLLLSLLYFKSSNLVVVANTLLR
jgi:hypothetical protein